MQSSHCAISGFGCVSAAGIDALSGHAAIEQKKVRNVAVGSEFFPSDFKAPCFRVDDLLLDDRFVQSVSGMDFSDQLYQERVNRTIRLALVAIHEALERAALTSDDLHQKRIGVVLGTTVGCTFHNEKYYAQWRRGQKPEPGPLFTYLSANLAASVQTLLGMRGPRLTLTNACASGTDAIGVGKSWIDNDLCDLVVAGGADELSRVASHGFKSLLLVSEKSCRPFDKDRQGLNLGEGAGILILEREKNVVKRCDSLYGWIRGYGAASDAYHPTAPHPDGRGLQLALQRGLAESGVHNSDISFINGHGTGTQANDQAETNALAAIGFESGRVPVISTKGATGHTLGGAGGVEAVYTLLTLNKGRVTGTVGCHERDPKFQYEVLQENDGGSLATRVGVNQSLAFGGGNGVLVIEGSGECK